MTGQTRSSYANSDKIDWKTREEIRKSVCIFDYTKNMDAGDHVDMQMSFSEMYKKIGKMTQEAFFSPF